MNREECWEILCSVLFLQLWSSVCKYVSLITSNNKSFQEYNKVLVEVDQYWIVVLNISINIQRVLNLLLTLMKLRLMSFFISDGFRRDCKAGVVCNDSGTRI